MIDGTDGAPVPGAIDVRALVRSYRRAVQQQVPPLMPFDFEISTIELTVASGASAEDSVLRSGDRLTLAMPGGTRARVLSFVPRRLAEDYA